MVNQWKIKGLLALIVVLLFNPFVVFAIDQEFSSEFSRKIMEYGEQAVFFQLPYPNPDEPPPANEGRELSLLDRHFYHLLQQTKETEQDIYRQIYFSSYGPGTRVRPQVDLGLLSNGGYGPLVRMEYIAGPLASFHLAENSELEGAISLLKFFRLQAIYKDAFYKKNYHSLVANETYGKVDPQVIFLLAEAGFAVYIQPLFDSIKETDLGLLGDILNIQMEQLKEHLSQYFGGALNPLDGGVSFIGEGFSFVDQVNRFEPASLLNNWVELSALVKNKREYGVTSEEAFYRLQDEMIGEGSTIAQDSWSAAKDANMTTSELQSFFLVKNCGEKLDN